ncbi:unnamed protein product [Rotaria sp. Silwood2]|nr:unnamed protein product [Rotaria sp. Silwood2]CAF4252950.1 unnamed protein product [Rotaria sp. Silwood2]CAF4316969.1 unnamed protein product [Rotaria sp. Silwood2]
MILLLPIVSSGIINKHDCSICAGSTYQIKISIGDGQYAYEVFVLQEDHTVVAIDSSQSGTTSGSTLATLPFTASIGKWSCCERNKVKLQVLDYNLPVLGNTTPGSIALVTTVLTVTNHGQNVKGTLGFSNYPLGVNPTAANAKPIAGQTFGPFDVSGERINFSTH